MGAVTYSPSVLLLLTVSSPNLFSNGDLEILTSHTDEVNY